MALIQEVEGLTIISAGEFEKSIIEVEEYNDPPNKITRPNFISWMTRSFAISRGYPAAHDAYICWSAVNSGLNLDATMENFLSVGGWVILSPAEKKYFLDRFKRVVTSSVHNDKKGHLDDAIGLYLNDYAERFRDIDVDDTESIVPNGKFEALTRAQFLINMNDYIKGDIKSL